MGPYLGSYLISYNRRRNAKNKIKKQVWGSRRTSRKQAIYFINALYVPGGLLRLLPVAAGPAKDADFPERKSTHDKSRRAHFEWTIVIWHILQSPCDRSAVSNAPTLSHLMLQDRRESPLGKFGTNASIRCYACVMLPQTLLEAVAAR